MRVLVTGAAGCLAAVLLPALLADPTIECVTGVDVRPVPFEHPRFNALRADIADARLRPHLPRHDALVHLAFVVLRGRCPESEMRRVNVQASADLLRAARNAGMRRLILLSSAALYGTGTRLAEDALSSPLPGFAYAEHKAALEAIVARDLPECVRLRPHAVLGRCAQPLLRWLLRQPFYPRLPRPEPLIQCVHESDVVVAIRLALLSSTAGAFNLAASDTFSYGEAIRTLHRSARSIPLPLARTALTAAWRLTGFGGEPRWIDGLALPLTLDCRRAREDLGWEPSISAVAALTETAA